MNRRTFLASGMIATLTVGRTPSQADEAITTYTNAIEDGRTPLEASEAVFANSLVSKKGWDSPTVENDIPKPIKWHSYDDKYPPSDKVLLIVGSHYDKAIVVARKIYLGRFNGCSGCGCHYLNYHHHWKIISGRYKDLDYTKVVATHWAKQDSVVIDIIDNKFYISEEKIALPPI